MGATLIDDLKSFQIFTYLLDCKRYDRYYLIFYLNDLLNFGILLLQLAIL